MNYKSFNASYSFTLGGIRFKIDIDHSLSAEINREGGFINESNMLHYHPMHELFFVFGDPLKITTEDEELEYQGSVVCLPPFIEHRSKGKSYYRLLFSYEVKERGGSPLADFFASCFTPDKIFCSGTVSPELRAYLEELCRLTYNKSGELEKELVTSVLRLIFYHVYKGSSPEVKENADNRKESYYLIIDRMINRCTEPNFEIDLASIAEELHLSKKQTARIINKYYKKPLSVLVLEKKLEFARYLIASTRLPISEVAQKANFRSENYFYSKFKNSFGCTPLHYRKNGLGEN